MLMPPRRVFYPSLSIRLEGNSRPLTFTTQIVLFSTRVPGAPKTTIPPSCTDFRYAVAHCTRPLTVGLLTMLFRTIVFMQLTLIPSAHCWYASVPQGPMSLFCIVWLLHLALPQCSFGGVHPCGFLRLREDVPTNVINGTRYLTMYFYTKSWSNCVIGITYR